LLARVEALTRRSAAMVKDTVLHVSDLRMDLVLRTVTRSGRDIELLPREFQVLEYLVCDQGEVVPRAMLLQHVWDLHFDPATKTIDVYVRPAVTLEPWLGAGLALALLPVAGNLTKKGPAEARPATLVMIRPQGRSSVTGSGRPPMASPGKTVSGGRFGKNLTGHSHYVFCALRSVRDQHASRTAVYGTVRALN
jgi:hypothetical protein